MTAYALADRVVHKPIADLVDDPDNDDLHPPFQPQGEHAWLVEDVAHRGVLMPLLLRADGRHVVDGRTRRAAAKYCGLDTVPTVTLAEGEEAAFASAQLARNLSLYAKCRLHRGRIDELIGQAKRNMATNDGRDEATRAEDAEALDEAWAQVEQILAVSRRRLREGVQLLDRLGELQAGGAKDRATAVKVERVFRERGFRPARRLLGEGDVDDSADDHPDCRSWGAESSPCKRQPRKCAAKSKPASSDADRAASSRPMIARPDNADDVVAAVRGIIGALWSEWDYDDKTIHLDGTFSAKELAALAILLETEQLERAL